MHVRLPKLTRKRGKLEKMIKHAVYRLSSSLSVLNVSHFIVFCKKIIFIKSRISQPHNLRHRTYLSRYIVTKVEFLRSNIIEKHVQQNSFSKKVKEIIG